MLRKLKSHNRVSFESLEGRWLMAGDVTATVVDGNLFIVGDDFHNRISITDGANPGEVTVTGFDDGNGDPTDVEGTPNGAVTRTGVTGNIVVTMKGGHDVVSVYDLNAARNLTINLADGNDGVYLGATGVDGTGTVPAALATAAASLPTGLLGSGPVNVGRHLLLNTGPGDDLASLSETTVAEEAAVNTGVGDYQVFAGVASVQSAPRALQVTIVGGTKAKDLAINTGWGADHVRAYGLDVSRALGVTDLGGVTEIDLEAIAVNHAIIGTRGDGGDNVAIRDMHALNVAILTGGDNADTVTIEDSTFKRLEVLLFGGDDKLSIGNTEITTQAFFDGGAGDNDTFEKLAPNTISNAIRRRFEHLIV